MIRFEIETDFLTFFRRGIKNLYEKSLQKIEDVIFEDIERNSSCSSSRIKRLKAIQNLSLSFRYFISCQLHRKKTVNQTTKN